VSQIRYHIADINQYLGLFVEFQGWYENDESVFIAMEFIENRDLDSKLTEPLPEEEARTITLQLVEGLMFLHENNFVHRDFKPKVSGSYYPDSLISS
jgi:calcium/calmodulin-dependent protein kinase I